MKDVIVVACDGDIVFVKNCSAIVVAKDAN